MELCELKKLVHDFSTRNIPNNPGYISILVLEEYLKKVCTTFTIKTQEYISYLEKKFKVVVDSVELGPVLSLHCHNSSLKSLSIFISGNSITYALKSSKSLSLKVDEILGDDAKTIEYQQELKILESLSRCSNSNCGLYIYLDFITSKNRELLFAFHICDSKMYNQKSFECIKKADNMTINYVLPKVENLITIELMSQIYVALSVDISFYPENIQKAIRDLSFIMQAKLNEVQQKTMEEFRKLQVDRVMRAYALMKEATQLLNCVKLDIGFNKIKIADINKVFFKNGGLPNSEGYIEIEDVFRNNMILRMLDLEELDLTNVDIRSMDFSGTNVHIDPQRVYHKDLSYVNAKDVSFNPFWDSFSDTILDGTIINDYRAMINLQKVRSYNAQTLITEEVIDEIARK